MRFFPSWSEAVNPLDPIDSGRICGRRSRIQLAAGALLVAAARMASAGGLDPCLFTPCIVVSVDLNERGSGHAFTTDGYGGPAIPGIDCQWNGSAKSGTCTKKIVFELEQSYEVNLGYTASTGSELCQSSFSNTWTGTQYWTTGTLSAPATISATTWDFCVEGARLVTATRSGTGSGTVTSDPAAISCGAGCAASFPRFSQVALLASAAPGSTFEGWTGDCTGLSDACQFTLQGDSLVDAAFSSPLLFADGFESDDVSSWSAAQGYEP